MLGEEHPFFTNHNEEMLKAMVHAAKAREAQTGEAATLQTVLDCVNDEEYLREAIEVRDPGRIVVWAEEIPETITATTTRKASGPSTSSATLPSTPALSSNLATRSRPAVATSATATAT